MQRGYILIAAGPVYPYRVWAGNFGVYFVFTNMWGIDPTRGKQAEIISLGLANPMCPIGLPLRQTQKRSNLPWPACAPTAACAHLVRPLSLLHFSVSPLSSQGHAVTVCGISEWPAQQLANLAGEHSAQETVGENL